MKLTVFVHPSLVIIKIHLVCLIYLQFHNMTYMSTPLSQGVMKFTFLVNPSLVSLLHTWFV